VREYSTRISLTNNSRGVYSLDPSLGCHSGTINKKNGCYNDCYAAKISRGYGYDFTKTVLRDFENESHLIETIQAIDKIPLPFVRMGTMGDPSENWEHALKICRLISRKYQLSLFERPRKQIVIITKHWTNLTDQQLIEMSGYNICVNSSVSALDDPKQLDNGVEQFIRLKPYCKSVLRIVSADFNAENQTGKYLSEVQDRLFKNSNTLDTVLRVGKNNKYVIDGIIKIKQGNFLGSKQYLSKFNKKTYLGKCDTCLEMCGVTI
jgi:hypothetical protein